MEILFELVDKKTKEIKDKADKTAEVILNLREDLSNTRNQLSNEILKVWNKLNNTKKMSLHLK